LHIGGWRRRARNENRAAGLSDGYLSQRDRDGGSRRSLQEREVVMHGDFMAISEIAEVWRRGL